MSGQIDRRLGPVRRRQRAAWAARGAAWGLLCGAVVAMIAGALRLATGGEPWPLAGLVALATGPVLGALAGLCRRGARHAAAAAVDAAYRLKDRTVSALAFAARAGDSPLLALQVDDAMRHLDGVDPRRAVPIRMPRALPYAASAVVAAAVLLGLPASHRPVEAGPAPVPDSILAEKERIAEDLERLRELAREEREEPLEELIERLLIKAEALEEPGTDLKEFLATVSEMQAALAAQQAQYNLALVDSQLQSLGEAMSVSQSLDSAGQALQQGEFDKAAEQLQQVENPEIDRKEARALKEHLEQVAKAMGEAGLGQLSQSVAELVDAIEDGDPGLCQGSCDKIGRQVKAHAGRKKLGLSLAAQCDRLGECKSNCQSNSLAKVNMPQRSTSPSSNFGLGTSGNELGDPTRLDSERRREEITGTQGDGPSDVEVTHSPEGRQVATREYREAYEKHRKLTEAALESEPIPLGHRQTIRTYFELIRPQAGDEVEPPASNE